jgi:hypothetical protein
MNPKGNSRRGSQMACFAHRTLAPFAALAFAALLGGCVVAEDHHRSDNVAPSGAGGAVGAAPSGPSSSPMLVTVDTDQTLNAAGGAGVGVFVEYKHGGHWHVWWACDTSQTGQSCDFSITATAASGTLRNVDGTALPGGFFTSPTPTEIDAKATTTTDTPALDFDSDPGAIVTIGATVGGVTDGAFLFFVQDGQLNGGFAGKLTNPLKFQGSAP